MNHYSLTDAYGRDYFEGRTFERDAALAEAKTISEESRPFGVFLIPEKGGEGEEIYPASKAV